MQALQHCTFLRERLYMNGLGIALLLRTRVEPPVGAISEKDDEVDAITATAVGVFDAQDGLDREACDANRGHLCSHRLARDVILPP